MLLALLVLRVDLISLGVAPLLLLPSQRWLAPSGRGARITCFMFLLLVQLCFVCALLLALLVLRVDLISLGRCATVASPAAALFGASWQGCAYHVLRVSPARVVMFCVRIAASFASFKS